MQIANFLYTKKNNFFLFHLFGAFLYIGKSISDSYVETHEYEKENVFIIGIHRSKSVG